MMGKVHVEICMLSNKNNSHTIFMEAPTNRNTKLTPPTPFPKFQPRRTVRAIMAATEPEGITGLLEKSNSMVDS